MQIDLSIIYVNWNSLEYLRKSIASVYKYTDDVTSEIIVVDNASTEKGLDLLAQEFPTITVVENRKNMGFAAANNVGVRHSVGDYVLFLNPDTELFEPSINVMLDAIKSLSDAGAVGCKLLNADLTLQVSSIQPFPTILNQILDAEYLQLRWPRCPLWRLAPLFTGDVRALEVEVVPGACILIKRKTFEQVGMFTEDYFMYAEDLDLNYKLKHAGLRNYYIGRTSIVHYGGRSSAQQRGSHWATTRRCMAMLQLFRNTRGHAYGWLYRVTTAAAAVIRLALLFLMSAATLSGSTRFGDKQSLELACMKWKAVLRWAVGRELSSSIG